MNDTNHIAHRGKNRIKNAVSSSLMSAVARMAIVLASFISIPLTSSYLGSERFGIWMVVGSFSALLAFADLGIGNGLINLISNASAREDKNEMRLYVVNAFFVLFASGAVIFLIFLIFSSYFDLASLFHLTQAQAVNEIREVFLLYGFLFSVGIPVNITQKIQIGLQRGYVNGLWNVAASMLSLAAVVLAIHLEASLIGLIFALVGVPLLVNIVYLLKFFIFEKRYLIPKKKYFSIGIVNKIMSIGLLYFILQLCAALSASSDNVVIASVLGASEVGDYGIALRLFSIISILTGLILQPLWPAYSEALASGDRGWIKRIFLKSTLIIFLSSGIVSGVLIIFHQTIALFWLDRRLNVSLILVFGFALWSLVDTVNMSIATLLNGNKILIPQIFSSALFGLSSFFLKINLLKTHGVEILPWIAMACSIVFSLIPMCLVVKTKVLGFQEVKQ